MDEWLSILQACQITKLSERTIRRRIKDGKIQTRMQSGRCEVFVTSDMARHTARHMARHANDNETPDALISQLQSENEYLRAELKSARERSDTIILHLTQQIEQQQRLLEYKKVPWWRRWIPRVQKPP